MRLARRDYAPPSTLVDLLRERANELPARQAYTFVSGADAVEEGLTYEGLYQKAMAIAALLRRSDASRGDRAVLLFPPGLDYIVALFGCLCAGVVAIPTYPPRHNRPTPALQAIIQNAEPKFALTTEAVSGNLERRLRHAPYLRPLTWLSTDGVGSSVVAADGLQFPASDDPELSGVSLAFLQYTSGSTSSPKGVMLNHRNLLHNLASIKRNSGIKSESRNVSWLPPYHDMGLIGGVLQTLYTGSSLTLMAPADFIQNPVRWLRAITRDRATASGAPNFAYDLCVREITPDQRATLDLSSWELAFTGAEPVNRETMERFVATFAPYGFRREAFYPCYGLAEATLMVSGGSKAAAPHILSLNQVALRHNRASAGAADSEADRKLVSCGRTIMDQKIVIADPESRRRCAPDQVGEIWVTGPSVAQGYWNRPEETEYAFKAYLADTEEGPFLRTGDLGFLRDGEVFVTGRLKDLIIIRGHNHYPQDVESTTAESHPALRANHSAAFVVDDREDSRLVIVQEVERLHRKNLHTDEVISAIRRAVGEHHGLQVHAVVLVRAGSIPKTTSGKVQRHVCRERYLLDDLNVIACRILGGSSATQNQGYSAHETYVAPRSAAEEKLAGIWAEALRLQRVGVYDNFFEMGGDSLLSVQVQAQAERAGIYFTPAQLSQNPTVAQLIATVSADPVVNADQGVVQGTVPLMPFQQAFLATNMAEFRLLSVGVLLKTRRALDPLLLEIALKAVLDHHDALRLRFVRRDTAWHQYGVAAEDNPIFHKVDLSDTSDSEREATIKETAEKLRNSLSPSQGPLLKAAYLDSGAGEPGYLLIVIHHFAFDGASGRILLEDLENAYEKLSRGEAPELPPKTTSFKYYAERVAEYVRSPRARGEIDYWLALAETPVPRLPADHPWDSSVTGGCTVPSSLDADEGQILLREVTTRYGARLHEVLLASLLQAFAKWIGERRMIIHWAHHGRTPDFEDVNLSRTVGWLTSLVPVLLDARDAQEPGEVLELVKRQVREIPSEGLGYFPLYYMNKDAKIAKEVQSVRFKSQVYFNFLGRYDQAISNSSLFSVAEPYEVKPRVPVANNLRISGFITREGGLHFVWRYNANVYRRSTITKVARDFENALKLMIMNR